MLDSTEERTARLARMAYLYYVEGKNQVEVAERMGLARPMVSRQLKEAEEAGIVKISVDYPCRSKRLEEALKERFGLAEPRIFIVEGEDEAGAKRLLGQGAAAFLNEVCPQSKRIAISWGSTLADMIRALDYKEDKGHEVVQLIGATGRENNPNDGPLIARALAERLSARLYLLHAPLIVESELVASALMKDKVVRETLDKAASADIAFVGIGSLDTGKNSLYRAGYLSEKEVLAIKEAGAVGDTCAQFFDAQGNILDLDINRRVIGLPLEELAKVPRVIAVTLGAEKVASLVAALRGQRITGLITDHRTAELVLEADASSQLPR